MSDGVLLEKAGAVATITLNRPDRGNSYTRQMREPMRAIWAEVRDDEDIRVAIVTGAGRRHFCTGQDVDFVAANGVAAGDGPLAAEVIWSPRHNDVWKPVIAAVNGTVVGGGFHFVVDADIVFASSDAQFLDSHVNVGMVGAVENIGLARRLPLGAALRMTLVGRDYRMSAERAHQLGLVDEVVPADQLMALAQDTAASIARNSPRATELSKRAIWGSLDLGYTEALEQGWELLKSHWTHPDFVEGPRAFTERREPRWQVGPVPAAGDES